MRSEITLPSTNDDRLLSSIIGDPRQRRLLSLLLERSRPITDRELAVELAARERKISPSAVTGSDHRPIRADLHHRYLPKLEAAGWIERRGDEVVATEKLSVTSPDVSLPELDDPDLRSWDALAALLSRPRRRHIVSIIADHHRPLTLEELRTELIASERSSRTGGEGDGGSHLRAALHHVDLPRLADAGVITYDPDERTITPTRSLGPLVNRLNADTT